MLMGEKFLLMLFTRRVEVRSVSVSTEDFSSSVFRVEKKRPLPRKAMMIME